MADSGSLQFPSDFLWGAATSAHQTEGNNVSSDWWAFEQAPNSFLPEPSGDAIDSWNRWKEDVALAAAAGLKDYRFSVEWARIEPQEGYFSRAAIAHYRAMVEGVIAAGMRPMVTLHHFTMPLWLALQGAWKAPNAVDRFLRYIKAIAPVIESGVPNICTINEPNVVSVFPRLAAEGAALLANGLPEPDAQVAARLIDAHQRAVAQLHADHPHIKVGWSVSAQCIEAMPGAEEAAAAYAYLRQTQFFEAARNDDWVGVQCYTRIRVGQENGAPVLIPKPADAAVTLTGWEFYPPALGSAVRDAARITRGLPVIVTENGVATADDAKRIEYTAGALSALHAAMADGIKVLGYYHWSLLDNYEWGKWKPTFGLIHVDRETFERVPKPSLAWLGKIAKASMMLLNGGAAAEATA